MQTKTLANKIAQKHCKERLALWPFKREDENYSNYSNVVVYRVEDYKGEKIKIGWRMRTPPNFR